MVDFLVIGPESVIGYNNVFPLIMHRRVFMGYKRDRGHMFFHKNDELVDVPNIRWFQNLIEIDVPKLELSNKYIPDDYKKYDDFDAINIDDYRDIPDNYFGYMGVPITFIRKWNPGQFDILDIMKDYRVNIDGRSKFSRILIRRKKDG